jgi:hypothetical protein
VALDIFCIAGAVTRDCSIGPWSCTYLKLSTANVACHFKEFVVLAPGDWVRIQAEIRIQQVPEFGAKSLAALAVQYPFVPGVNVMKKFSATFWKTNFIMVEFCGYISLCVKIAIYFLVI